MNDHRSPPPDEPVGEHAPLPDEGLDRLIDRARATYHPPPVPDLDALWRGVEARRGGIARSPSGFPRWGAIGLAASLILAFTMGRASVRPGGSTTPVAAVTPSASAPTPVTTTTTELLGQTAILLSALPADRDDPAADGRFAQQAGDLLVTTRLLLDTRAAQGNPPLRALLEDLELMLAQVARLRAGETNTERELITEALRQQNLVPRIRTLAAGLGAGAD